MAARHVRNASSLRTVEAQLLRDGGKECCAIGLKGADYPGIILLAMTLGTLEYVLEEGSQPMEDMMTRLALLATAVWRRM